MRKRTKWLLAVTLLLLSAVLGGYIAIGNYYRTHFFAGATVNGADVSNRTAEEAEALIAARAEDYQLIVLTKEGAQEVIEGEQIGYQFVPGGEVQRLLGRQNVLLWPFACLVQPTRDTIETSMTFDEAKLAEAVRGLACMQEEKTTAPVDAHVARQADGTYAIVPETDGNRLDEKKVSALLTEAIRSGDAKVNLAEQDCYLHPTVHADDPALAAQLETAARYTSFDVTYQMGGDVTERLDAATISSWFSLDEAGQPSFDRDAVAAWVDRLADRYDTIGTYRPFTTSNGATVQVLARTYGWQMDRGAETEELYRTLLAGNTAERTPVWLEGAYARKENDLGNSYVEIDYTGQRMWFYKNGILVAETPVVTGNPGAGNASPEGIFCIVDKEKDKVLVGEGYKTPVKFWLPFFDGVGIHDADTWRTDYGGNIYQYSGSHGCINTPGAAAELIYYNIDVGTPVVCYRTDTVYSPGQGPDGGAAGQTGDPGAYVEGGDPGIYIENGGTAQTEFPITIEDSWSDDGVIVID